MALFPAPRKAEHTAHAVPDGVNPRAWARYIDDGAPFGHTATGCALHSHLSATADPCRPGGITSDDASTRAAAFAALARRGW